MTNIALLSLMSLVLLHPILRLLYGNLSHQLSYKNYSTLQSQLAAKSASSGAPMEVVKGSGIYMTREENPFGGSSPQTRAFFVDRKGGHNLLMYSSSYIEELFPFIESRGGLELQLINHRDEVGPSINKVREHFGAPLAAHALEAPFVQAKGVVVDQLLFESKPRDSPSQSYEDPLANDTYSRKIMDGLWAVHTPGHTPGATCYLYLNRHDGKRYLFSGDTIYTSKHDCLNYALMFHPYEGNIIDYKASLARIRSLRPDVIIPSLSMCHQFAVEIQPSMFDPLETAIKENRLSV